MRIPSLLALAASVMLLWACRTPTKAPDTADAGDECIWYRDRDGDGYGDPESPKQASCNYAPDEHVAEGTDCDDWRADVHPGAEELCDETDNDCDGETDEGATGTWYQDTDGDGYGDPDTAVGGCAPDKSFVADGTDCDDTDPLVHPTAPERCDEIDNDCDGEIDEDLEYTWFADADGDGYGHPDTEIWTCDPGAGFVTDGTDCDDGNAAIHPDADEVCDGLDNDCDAEIDEDLLLARYRDADGDGYGDPAVASSFCAEEPGWVADARDCDDRNRAINPAATEICDRVDNDCDALVDEADPDIVGATVWYRDGDADGFGDDDALVLACYPPESHVRFGGDCDDTDAAFHPGAPETDCTDPNDYNCDGRVGYEDADGDGYAACAECDDADPLVFPGAPEVCNGVDDDCDGTVDGASAVDATTWYVDLDVDGYGDPATATRDCAALPGWISTGADCDDTHAEVNPATPEFCDGLDNDCDGAVDNGVGAFWYLDADADGYGDASISVQACERPYGYVADATDCDDSLFDVNPGAGEYCDGHDNDCDGLTDEAGSLDESTWYRDRDEDGYGDSAASTVGCTAPEGYVLASGDCNDRNDSIHPDASELCDSVDNDCDGAIDEDGAVDGIVWYADRDGDGYGDRASSVVSCASPIGYVGDGQDCDDLVAAVNPSATEICDGIDNDCDTRIDDADPSLSGATTWYQDADADGYGTLLATSLSCTAPTGYVGLAGDCDDTSGLFHPGALEDDCTDPSDYNCDGFVGYEDADGDGYAACAECDDANAAVFPGATETCNRRDDDCDGTVDEDDAVDAPTWHQDADGDGYGSMTVTRRSCTAPAGWIADGTDCDDLRATANPGRVEVCDGIDNDCDGSIDESGGSNWYRDADGDGYGDSLVSMYACTAPTGYVADATDCDDTLAAVYPGAEERCNAVDDDCDGSVDEYAVDMGTWYRDRDEDGYGDAAATTSACTAPAGYVSTTGDCNDRNDDIHPGATELCDRIDNDCDGSVDEAGAADAPTWYRDADGDGYGDAARSTAACTAPTGYVASSSDCDDDDSAIHPAAHEVCDDQDNDCDGLVDDADTSLVGAPTWYRDADGDTYGSSLSTRSSCDAPSGYVALAGDCNDSSTAYHPGAPEDDCSDPRDYNCDGVTGYADSDGDGYAACVECNDHNPAINPGATELCDGVDNDCDGAIDEDGATGALTLYQDADGDSFGNPSVSTTACSASAGWVSNALDCDDTNASIRPTASESCDERDNDCDGLVDEGVTSVFYRDVDDDGFGTTAATVSACVVPTGYSALSTDCDDAATGVYPGAAEYCDAMDNDCDGVVDEDSAVDAATWYRDRDGDGYGVSTTTTRACSLPAGYAAVVGDCNDTNGAVHPGADELCDTVDNDCDGVNNEAGAIGEATWYLDADTDGFGAASTSVVSCTAPTGYVSTGTDCDDANARAYPGAVEYCDLVDNDCDGMIDESSAADAATWYQDADGDGYGNPVSTRLGCSAPSGYVADNTDCDDRYSRAYPGATETCDLIDNDCDGAIDESSATDARTWYQDADADGYGNAAVSTRACYMPTGYVLSSSDCDDTSALANPAAAEACDGIDNNCDGAIDEGEAVGAPTWYRDADGDGYGSSTVTRRACSAPSGYIADGSDCNDADPSINPLGTETCDYADNDCDSTVDEGYKVGSKYVLSTDCGACGNDCATYTFSHASPYCRTVATTPYCAYTCSSGWVDVDGLTDNGCECGFVSADDVPFDGNDDNCDGEDGDHDLAVHVSTSTGSSSGDGSLAAPLASIQDGIDLAEADGLSYVLVAQGTYREAITVIEGISLLGGFPTDFMDRDIDVYATRIDVTSSSTPAVTAMDIDVDTVIDGFTIIARPRSYGSRGAIALWVEDCSSALQIRNNVIEAMDANDGADGTNGTEGTNGANGLEGVVGGYAYCSSLPDGGAGGINSCGGTLVDGGDGGGATCPAIGGYQESGENGYPSGLGGTGGGGGCDGRISSSSCGLCNIDGCWDPGAEGTPGTSGGYGTGGSGATDASGYLTGTAWYARAGASGSTGAYGSGGGGGGAGSGAYVAPSCGLSHLGGTGGGGGAGGCGGAGGTAGTGGGASIGLLLAYSAPTSDLPVFTDNVIASGDAGYGGDGGNGGLGGVGGLGGLGGNSARSTAWCGNNGGEGAPGGNGGGGGGAGGGAGGVSYAAWAVGVTPSSTWLSAANALDHGRAGEGGRGGLAGSVPGSPGTGGVNGSAGDQNW